MTNVNAEKYAPLVTLHGDALGIDAAGYLTGRGLSGMGGSSVGGYKGDRVRGYSGLLAPVFEGNDYKQNDYYHNSFFEDFLGAALPGTLNQNKGSDGSTAYAIVVANGGTARLTSGAGATHTMAVNGAQLTTPKTLLVSNGDNRFETRLGKISALTSQSFCFGLADTSTLNAPFTIAGTTVTANDTNAVCFVEDSAATGAAAKLNAVAVNAGGSPQRVNLGVDIDTAAFHIYRIELDASGNASFYIDGALVATIASAVATTAALCGSVGLFSNATSASQTLDIDYMLTQQKRV